MNFYAHTAEDAMGVRLPEEHWQLLAKHLHNVAMLAKAFARPLGMEAEAEMVGLLHDLGKYQEQFQQYLRFGKPRTPHAFIGAAAIAKLNNQLANIIAGHHAGLNDWAELRPELNCIRAERSEELGKYLLTLSRETKTIPSSIPAWEDNDAIVTELRTCSAPL